MKFVESISKTKSAVKAFDFTQVSILLEHTGSN